MIKGVTGLMKFYSAPMEGITGYLFRNAHAEIFSGIDKYYTPFISANTNGKFTSREWEDICPEHNQGIHVVPQILTNCAEDFIATSRLLQSLGYKEVNLNLGCPSGTVVSKNKGSGFLSQPEALNAFLEQVFEQTSMAVSIKTRIGKESPDEFERLMTIYNQYPIKELTIHPRIQKDYYKHKPNKEVFKQAYAMSKNPICYNGDIFTAADYNLLIKECPTIQSVMLGRGLICNPGLAEAIIDDSCLEKSQLRLFHDRLFEEYSCILYGERNVLFKMKELWFYMSYMFTHSEKYIKKIRKAQHFKDYKKAVDLLFEEQAINNKGGMFVSENNVELI